MREAHQFYDVSPYRLDGVHIHAQHRCNFMNKPLRCLLYTYNDYSCTLNGMRSVEHQIVMIEPA